MGKYDPRRYCCVCGTLLPDIGRQELIERGAGTIQGDGTYRFFCIGLHTKDEINEAINESIPAFTTGRILKERQRLI